MSHPNKFDTALLAESPAAKRNVTCSRCVDRLCVQLDFGRVSHQSGATHPHVLFSPLHYEPGYSYPLVVWLHGSGGDERQVMRIMPMLSMRNYVAVAPQGLTPESDATDASVSEAVSLDVSSILRGAVRPKPVHDWPETDHGFQEAERRVFDCISIARQRSNIATDRIFIAGYGSGGTMALQLGLLYPETFAGVASLGGDLPGDPYLLSRWSAMRDLAVFLGVCQASDAFSPEKACRAMELFHTAGLAMTVREYPGGQELSPPMLQDLNRWMMGIVCG